MKQKKNLFELKDVSSSQIDEVSSKIKDILLSPDSQKNILLIKGPMAAGKTTLVRHLVELLGGQGVQSPTFALHQRYSLPQFEVDHLDLYRMKSELELDGLGFWDFFAAEAGLVIIEWPEKMNTAHLPTEWRQLELLISTNQTTDSRNYLLLQYF